MPLPQEYRDELVATHAAAERLARFDSTREFLRTAGHILFWVACGLALLGLALHSDERAIGMMYWWAGHAVWVGGVTGALLAAYRRGERRGDW